jgi:hypothetical protein
MGKRAWFVVPAAVAAVCAFTAGASGSASVCTTAGATPAVAVKTLGGGARVAPAVVAGSKACVLSSKAPGSPSITIALFGGGMDSRIESEMYQGQVTSEGLTGLGRGAVFLSTADHTFQHLWFQAGGRVVKVTSDGSAHATPAKLVSVAHAIYSHLS